MFFIESLVLFLRKYSNRNGITVDGLKWLIGIADGVLRGYIILSNKVTLFLLFFDRNFLFFILSQL